MQPHADVEQILYTAAQLRERVAVLAERLSRLYRGKNPLYVGVLRGAFVFLADLVRSLDELVEIDFLTVSSYEGQRSTPTDSVCLVKDLQVPVADRHVVLVEDIVDSGQTLQYISKLLHKRKVASLRFVPLLIRPDFAGEGPGCLVGDDCGFVLPAGNCFLVGYGLDYGGQYRNLPYIGVLRHSIYNKLG